MRILEGTHATHAGQKLDSQIATLEQSEHEMEEADTDASTHASDVDSSAEAHPGGTLLDRTGTRRKSMPGDGD